MEFALEYIKFGIIVNVLSTIVGFVALLLKCLFLNLEESNRFITMSNTRSDYIKNANSILKRFANFMLILLPMYTFVSNAILVFSLIKYRGFNGIIKGIIAKDMFSFIPLVKYDFFILKDK